MRRAISFIVCFVLLLCIVESRCYGFLPPVSFEGEVGSTTDKDFVLNLNFPENGVISLTTKLLEENNFLVEAKVDHFKFLGFDLLLDFTSKGELINKDDGKITLLHGQAYLGNSVVNHKPSNDLEFYYEIAIDKEENNKTTFWLPFLRWGNVVSYGKVELFEGGQIDWNIFVSGAELEDFLDIFGKYLKLDSIGGDSSSGGQVWGKIVVGGLSISPRISGRIELVFDKNIDGYSKGIFNFDGKYPILKFFDSYFIEESGGRLVMEGNMDLNCLNNLDSPRHKLVYYPAETPYNLDSTIISTDAAATSRIMISREFLEADRLDFKSYFDESSSPMQDEDVVEMDVDLKNRKFFKMYLKEGEDIIGFGKRVKF